MGSGCYYNKNKEMFNVSVKKHKWFCIGISDEYWSVRATILTAKTIYFLYILFYKTGFAFFIRVFCRYIGFGLMLQWRFLFNISIKHAKTLF